MSTIMIQIKPNPNPTPTQPAVFAAPPDPPGSNMANVYAYDTVTWHNGDTQAHYPAPIVKGSVQANGWFDYQIPAGGTSDTLAPGPNPKDPTADYVLKYACALHPGETGQITVKPKS